MTQRAGPTNNAFRDSSFVPGEAESLRVRSELMAIARQLIEDRKFTQEMAAIVFGVTQPRISNLVRGKIDLFSVDGLIEMLSRAGVRIEIEVTHVPRQGSRAVSARVRQTPLPRQVP
jgi:predicted XRE-type DNA-binding protein